jgi:hypothetical protein
MVVDTWDTHLHEDMVEWVVLPAWLRTNGHTSGHGGRARGAVLTVGLVV